jgi:hypothetical protein
LTTAQTAALFHAAVQLLFSELMVVSGGINLAYMKPTGGTFFTASQPSSLAVDGEKATYAQCTNSNGGPQVLVPACRPACCAVARRSVATWLVGADSTELLPIRPQAPAAGGWTCR